MNAVNEALSKAELPGSAGISYGHSTPTTEIEYNEAINSGKIKV